MRRITFTSALSCFAAVVWLGLTPAFAGQKAHPSAGPVQSRGPKPTPPTPPVNPATPEHRATEGPKPTPAAKPTPPPKTAHFIARIENNPQLTSRLQPLLPSGMTLATAAQGFKTEGQFIAALHVSQNLKIPFTQLKAEMVRPDHDSLGQAIHDLQPSADAKAAVKTAEREAKADIKATNPARRDTDKDDR